MEFSMKHTNQLLGILHSWKPPISFISPTVNQAIVMVTDWSVLRLVCYYNKNVFTSGNPKDFHDRSSWDVHFFWTRKHRNANTHSHMRTMVLVYAQMHDWVINSLGFYVGVHMHHGERRMGHVFFPRRMLYSGLSICLLSSSSRICQCLFAVSHSILRHFLLHVDPFLPHFIMAYTYNLDDVELPHLLRFHVE